MVSDTIQSEGIVEALGLLDEGLSTMLHRDLVPSDEVANLLLDVRSLLAPAAMAASTEG